MVVFIDARDRAVAEHDLGAPVAGHVARGDVDAAREGADLRVRAAVAHDGPGRAAEDQVIDAVAVEIGGGDLAAGRREERERARR